MSQDDTGATSGGAPVSHGKPPRYWRCSAGGRVAHRHPVLQQELMQPSATMSCLQVTSNMIMSLTLKIKGGLNLAAVPIGQKPPASPATSASIATDQGTGTSQQGADGKEPGKTAAAGDQGQGQACVEGGDELSALSVGSTLSRASSSQGSSCQLPPAAGQLEPAGKLAAVGQAGGWRSWLDRAKLGVVGAVCAAAAAGSYAVWHLQGVAGEGLDEE